MNFPCPNGTPQNRQQKLAGVAGLEPVTSAVTGQRSNQLSYTPAIRGAASWIARQRIPSTDSLQNIAGPENRPGSKRSRRGGNEPGMNGEGNRVTGEEILHFCSSD